MTFYEKMDSERYEREAQIYKHFKYPQKGEGKFFNYRLLQPDEVPSWLMTTVIPFYILLLLMVPFPAGVERRRN